MDPRASVRAAGISDPINPLLNGESIPASSPYDSLFSDSTAPLNLSHPMAGSYEDVGGFSMDDTLPYRTRSATEEGQSFLRQAHNVPLTRADRQEGYDTSMLDLQPRGQHEDIEHLASPLDESNPPSPTVDRDPFATPPPPSSHRLSFSGSSILSDYVLPRKSLDGTQSVTDQTRNAAERYAARGREADRRQSSRTALADFSEKGSFEGEKRRRWRKVKLFAIIAILLAIIGVAVGVGVGLGMKSHRDTQKASGSSAAASSIPSSAITPETPITTPAVPSTPTTTADDGAWSPTSVTDWATYTGTS